MSGFKLALPKVGESVAVHFDGTRDRLSIDPVGTESSTFVEEERCFEVLELVSELVELPGARSYDEALSSLREHKTGHFHFVGVCAIPGFMEKFDPTKDYGNVVIVFCGTKFSSREIGSFFLAIRPASVGWEFEFFADKVSFLLAITSETRVLYLVTNRP